MNKKIDVRYAYSDAIAEHPAGSFGEQYCRAQPEKYPEI